MELSIKNLTKKYGENLALDSFSITFSAGIYGILGANGAGKSTLMNLISDNIKRDGGSITFDGKEMQSQVEESLKLCNLWNVKNKAVGQFSGGMKQRVLLAQALLGDPKVLILDEPTAGLDPKERVRIRSFIKELARDRIVLLATHIVSDIESIADKVLLMKKGRLLKMDTPASLMSSLPADWKPESGHISLEDVYLYYLGD